MIRGAATVVLAVAVLTGCGAGPELSALQDEKLADLSRTEVAGSVQEYERQEDDAGTTLGKPSYATVHVSYRLTGDPEATFEQIRQIAIDDGWTMKDPSDGVVVVYTSGEKRVDGYRGDIGITFVPEGEPIPSGGKAPVVLIRLRALP